MLPWMEPVMVPSSLLLSVVNAVFETFISVGFPMRSFNPGISPSSSRCSVAPLSITTVISLRLGWKVFPLVKVANVDPPLARLAYELLLSPARRESVAVLSTPSITRGTSFAVAGSPLMFLVRRVRRSVSPLFSWRGNLRRGRCQS